MRACVCAVGVEMGRWLVPWSRGAVRFCHVLTRREAHGVEHLLDQSQRDYSLTGSSLQPAPMDWGLRWRIVYSESFLPLNETKKEAQKKTQQWHPSLFHFEVSETRILRVLRPIADRPGKMQRSYRMNSALIAVLLGVVSSLLHNHITMPAFSCLKLYVPRFAATPAQVRICTTWKGFSAWEKVSPLLCLDFPWDLLSLSNIMTVFTPCLVTLLFTTCEALVSLHLSRLQCGCTQQPFSSIHYSSGCCSSTLLNYMWPYRQQDSNNVAVSPPPPRSHR